MNEILSREMFRAAACASEDDDAYDALMEHDAAMRDRLAAMEAALKLIISRQGCNCTEWGGLCDECDAAHAAADRALEDKP